jgi:hypothetical protein
VTLNVIEVVESFAAGKSPDRSCEDVVVVTDHFAAVIDGGTDLSGRLYGGMPGGLFAARTIADEIRALEPDVGVDAFVARLAHGLRRAVTSVDGPLRPDTVWPYASVVCLSAARRQVWRVGDCHAVVDGAPHHGGKRVDDAAYAFRAAVTAALLARGTPIETVLADDPGTQASLPLYEIQQHLANRPGPWGYGVVNGDPVPPELVDVLTLPDHAHEVVLASDGYPEILATLADSERRLRELLAEDPTATGPLWRVGKSLRPGHDSMDDRAWLRLAVAAG